MNRPPSMLPYICILAGVLLLLILIAWAGRAGRPLPAARSAVFRHNAFFRGFAFVSAFGIAIGLTFLVYIYPPRNEEVWYILGLYVFFSALTFPLAWEASRFYIQVTPDGMNARSAWHGKRSMTWSELDEVQFSAVNAWFVFRSLDGPCIRAHAFVGGLKELVRLVELQVPPIALKNAKVGYERLGLTFPEIRDEPELEARPPRRPGEW